MRQNGHSMRLGPRELPARPHLDHLKAQAKDLLRAHKRGDADAISRVRASLPGAKDHSEDQVRAMDLALHDAQSVIAREHGQKSWADLRAEVAARAADAFPESLLHTLVPMRIPPPLADALRKAWVDRHLGEHGQGELPAALPLVPLRNAFVVPGALLPIVVGRAPSLAAVLKAQGAKHRSIAVFSQRDAAHEDVDLDGLHPIGCEARVCDRLPGSGEDGPCFVVLEGQRWIRATGLDQVNGHRSVCIEPLVIERPSGDDAEVTALAAALRERARLFASSLPDPERSRALVDSIDDPLRLADLVVGNLPSPIDHKARYAALTTAAGRLREALTLADRSLDILLATPAL